MFIFIYYRVEYKSTSRNTVLIAFNKERSQSLPITLGNASLKNNHVSLLSVQMKLFSCLLDNNTKVIEILNHVKVTPIISNNHNLYLLILYVLSINKMILNVFNNLTTSRCV